MQEKIFIRKDVARALANETNLTIKDCEVVLGSLGDIVYDMLMQANKENNISICLTEGIKIKGTYRPSRKMKSNFTGGLIDTKPKVKASVKFSPAFTARLIEEV